MKRLQLIGILGCGGTSRRGVYYRVINSKSKEIREILDQRDINKAKEGIYTGDTHE